ncbi:hypothetical protein SAMN05518672_102536 [Chitinophaga sp. CF118]|uniref:hypothetical protein n=1 Tax=Chitinophaga sp. CF118 TaxID=1884367 RepID=UPI0008E238B8|nr:hypothetical protein [Chitinophaga sp. CF118]SFD59409.1 hypothetical protein SAMN05518672_102536 [Chitinophaga sp. CF118]
MIDVREKIDEKINALTEKARITGKPEIIRVKARNRSALGLMVRTKEQADACMAALRRSFEPE